MGCLFINWETHTHIECYCADDFLVVNDRGGRVDNRGDVLLVFDDQWFERDLHRAQEMLVIAFRSPDANL